MDSAGFDIIATRNLSRSRLADLRFALFGQSEGAARVCLAISMQIDPTTNPAIVERASKLSRA